MQIDAKMVMALRQKTGAPMMDCKQALTEAGGNDDKAIEILRKRGMKTAEGLVGRQSTEGLIFSYVHHNGRIGVLAEVSCETDFVARNEEFKTFGRELCMHIAAMRPKYLDQSAVDPAFLASERRIYTEQAQEQMKGKPAEIIAKAVEGRVQKVFAEVCLVDQPWFKDGNVTVGAVLKTLAGKIGENLAIRRFTRIEMGT